MGERCKDAHEKDENKRHKELWTFNCKLLKIGVPEGVGSILKKNYVYPATDCAITIA